MKSPTLRPSLLSWSSISLGACLLSLPLLPGTAGATDLSNQPLTYSSSTPVLPNIFFILDNSGSMNSNFMPDYVDESGGSGYCRSSATARMRCAEGDPPWYLAAFNGVYYNPAVRYRPPVEATGANKAGWNGWLASSGNWTNVPVDGYNKLSSNTINLATGYPERIWCDSSNRNCQPAIDSSGNYNYRDRITHPNASTIYGAPFYYTGTVQWCSGGGSPWGSGTCIDRKTSTYRYVKYSNWKRIDIKPTTTLPAKASARTDCAASTCTYSEEMANFANWYAWYRTRIQMMKTAMGLAFKDVRGTPNPADPDDGNYFHARIGYTTISDTTTRDSTTYLPIRNFDSSGTSAQKGLFYSRLFSASGDSWTPLRGALSKAGQLYAGVIGTDPVQYTCQKNYTILSTDGYWNTNTETYSYTSLKVDGRSGVGDMDGANAQGVCNSRDTTPICNDNGACFEPTTDPVAASSTSAAATLPECDRLKQADTLADIAYYYYHTDLRPGDANGNCVRANCMNNVPASGSNKQLDDVATWQHMTTFTIGLGVDGTLAHADGYKTASSGDFAEILAGNRDWPDPIANMGDERIDDLWHAAVNGRGTYFSAKDPASLAKGLADALSSIASQTGTGSSVGTANLNATQGEDNYIYRPTYTSGDWTSDIVASPFTSSGVGSGALWHAGALLDGLVSGTCGDAETRTIYTGASTRKLFAWNSLTTDEQAYFDNSKLSQYADWDATMKTDARGQSLMNYIRGHNRYEDRTRTATWQGSCSPYHRYYRNRKSILGDIVHSQPLYVRKSWAQYTDDGYSAFASGTGSRAPRLFAGSNDGMLHALDADTGKEVWAYIPPIVMPDLFRLADAHYANNHRYFIDGPLAASDIFDGSWKTLLFGTLGKGGRGIFALDVTETGGAYPKVMWNFTAADDPDLGYTYGAPLPGKLKDGTWVVVLASGYNNIPNTPNTGDYPTSNGGGYVFVLRASDGKLLKKISTGVGTTRDPAGLENLEVDLTNKRTDATIVAAYGGDLQGNLWSFDIEAGTSRKVASLSQPIQAAPAVVRFDDGTGNLITVLYVGTGRYLGQTDLTNIGPQSIYAIKDDGSTLVTPGMLSALSTNQGTSFDWAHKFGWSMPLGGGELVQIAPQLLSNTGILAVATTVPTATACEAGGHGYMHYLDYDNGFLYRSDYFSSPPAGFTFLTETDADQKVAGKLAIPKADGSLEIIDPPLPPERSGTDPTESSGTPKRIMWRELPSE